MDRTEKTLQIFLEEYRVLKAEQNSRIGFRDNLLYVTLGLFGGILSFALTNDNGTNALLVVPWVCIVMGWTYVVNDEKISAIGRYIRHNLEKRISNLIEGSADSESLFGWEKAHRSDSKRTSRKYLQLLVDEVAFVFSGLAAIVLFCLSSTNCPTPIIILIAFESFFLISLGITIAIYADLAKGR
ncbi:hypothetical protein [Acaryochloris marina]|uniref:Integral membrane protein n=1 Tax=Acaryochloris marina (strain MBIC 11017) TaxID=329726 RepID=A8ZLG1_ACAM1|nr:hypothetical protein [Acaryochloris marina]ABW31988.1 hypothetical protein AM1_B0269 [Acaryochloris marina MBIC11017]